MTKAERLASIRDIRKRNTVIVRAGRGKYTVRLKIDHQSFQIGEMGNYSKHGAAWMTKQTAIALHRFKHGI